MHVRPDILYRLTSEVLDILIDTGSVRKKEVNDPIDEAMADEVAPPNIRVVYRRSWDDRDEDGNSDMEKRSKARYELVKWLRYSSDLNSELMERMVAIGVMGELVWWGQLLQEVLDRTGGLKQIGSGAYGVVFLAEEAKMVLKISMCAATDAWHTYARKVMDTEGNPFLPRIYGVWFWHNTMVAKMEHLECDELFKEDGGDMFRTLIYSKTEGRAVIENHFIGGLERSELVGQWLDQVHQVARETFEETNGGWDCHNGNLLFRDGIPVLTDPVAGGYCPYAEGMYNHHVELKEKMYAP